MFRVADTAGALGAVRRYFGLSQADMAPFLGLPQAAVARAESGARALSLRAGQRLALLTACLPAGGEAEASGAPLLLPASTPLDPLMVPTPLDPLDGAALLARQRQCEAAAARARTQLDRLTERATQARRRLEALPALRAAEGPPPAGPTAPAARDHERHGLWLALFENEARIVLARDSPTAQALLKLRLGALEYEAAQVRALLARA